ncbi:flap endonuclease Xni [Corallincola luteus]|uniref:Flap endonuclease Xni n=2 Tax=Corallincola TaxID=1775176 RepID=A0A368NFG6_9GAMM|nr:MULTISPECIES: flap endonuclease Xni [Corallincola]RCU48850.1 flap endonuclease Xni [Corallincola holothuriorum]TCI02991.1 flap endonuclease Xni [Corallincola luteus]
MSPVTPSALNKKAGQRGRIILLDGMNMVRRIYAACSRHSEHNALEQTLSRCTQTLNRVVKQHRPTHALCVFDGDQPNWRRDLLANYKISRKGMPSALKLGLEQIQEAFWQMGVDSLLSESDEADDLIATLSSKSCHHADVIIISTDHGFGQLLSPQVHQWDCFARQFLDINFYQQRYQLHPHQLPLFNALVGSNSHDIKGIKGVGAKTASSLLNRYTTIDALLRADDIPEKISLKLHEQQEKLHTNFKILTYRTEIPLGFSMSDIRYQRASHD